MLNRDSKFAILYRDTLDSDSNAVMHVRAAIIHPITLAPLADKKLNVHIFDYGDRNRSIIF